MARLCPHAHARRTITAAAITRRSPPPEGYWLPVRRQLARWRPSQDWRRKPASPSTGSPVLLVRAVKEPHEPELRDFTAEAELAGRPRSARLEDAQLRFGELWGVSVAPGSSRRFRRRRPDAAEAYRWRSILAAFRRRAKALPPVRPYRSATHRPQRWSQRARAAGRRSDGADPRSHG